MSNRDVQTGIYISNDESKIYTTKENRIRKELYKKAINRCCYPECSYGFDLHLHHILPISRGGTDDFTNYIVLCKRCHKSTRLHRWSSDRRLEITVYKFYIEKLELGFCSDEMSNEEFELKLREYIANRAGK